MAEKSRVLHVVFDSDQEFRREYASNIVNGGIFVPTNVEFEVREAVCVEIVLTPRDVRIELEGEVVHVFSPEMAGAGVEPGVAVQFHIKSSDLRAQFEPYVDSDLVEDEVAAQVGQRAARRIDARLDARIQAENGEAIEGQTRDISSRGILFTADATPIAVGERVSIWLFHHGTGREMEAEGSVVRHVRGFDDEHETDACGTGVAFDLRSAAKADAVAEFVDEVRIAEHRRRMGGIGGPISELGLANLIQMFGTCSQEGTLLVFRGEDEGFIVFRSGMLIGVRIGNRIGQVALAEMLNWTEGSFEFHASAHIEDGEAGETLSLDAALLDAMRTIDESHRDAAAAAQPGEAHDELDDLELDLGDLDGSWEAIEPLALDATFDVDAGHADSEGLSKAEAAVVDLAMVGMSVAKILDIIPEPESEIRQILESLIDRGILRVE